MGREEKFAHLFYDGKGRKKRKGEKGGGNLTASFLYTGGEKDPL